MYPNSDFEMCLLFIKGLVSLKISIVKDTKPNFREAPSCRLINPTKSEIGKVSKQILSKLVAKGSRRFKKVQFF